MRKCKYCKEVELPPAAKCDDIIQKKGYCSVDCVYGHARDKRIAYDEKLKRKKMREAKERIKSRSEWLDKLQRLVNQYVVHVRDKGKACCTCGTTKDVQYAAGHCFTRGARKDLRFELTNIHKQCNVYCNDKNSGFQEKHKQFIAEKYGQDHLDKLSDESQWPMLKETFPDYHAIKDEIARYRKLLRKHGLTPSV